MLKISQRYDSKSVLEKIFRTEETLARNNNAYLRSRSLQTNKAPIKMYHAKKEDILFKRKGKRSSGIILFLLIFIDTKSLIRDSIRKNRKKSKRKRSESFDFSMFVSQSRLDESSSDDEEVFEEEDSFENFNHLSKTNPSAKKDWSTDVNEIKEDNEEDISYGFKNNSNFSFGSFKMKVESDPKEKEEESPEFKSGYKMQTV